MNDNYLWDRSGPPDADAQRLEKALGAFKYDRPLRSGADPIPMRRGRRLWLAPLAVAASLALLVWTTVPHLSRDAAAIAIAEWSVESVAGTIQIDERAITQSDKLRVGEWLVTDAASRARVSVADIGHLNVAGNSRLRLKASHGDSTVMARPEHRIELAHGRIDATIYAPPRLFIVDTPAAQAVDLGCIYTLEVDDSGAGLLEVSLGWVELNSPGRLASVPTGAECRLRPGVGPGTPYFDDASAPFRASLDAFDFSAGGGAALDTVLSEARPRDTLTLWHLLSRVDTAMRSRVFERLAKLAPPPPAVSRAGVLKLDHETLEQWKESLQPLW